MFERLVLLATILCALDYIIGFVVTHVLHLIFKKYLGLPSFRWKMEWISVRYGVTELTCEIGPFVWSNPRKFPETPYFARVERISVRLKPLTLWGWFKKSTPFEIDHIEAQGVTVHLERSKKYGLNLWACLGSTEAEFIDQIESAVMNPPVEESLEFEETGEVEEDDGKKKKAPKGDNWGVNFLGRFDVHRITFRGINAHIGAFLSASASKGIDSNPIKIVLLDMGPDELRPGKRSKRKQTDGLYLDELIMRAVRKVVNEVIKANKLTLVSKGASAAIDHAAYAANAAGKGASNVVLNATHSSTVRVNERLKDLPKDSTLPSELIIRVIEGKHLVTEKKGDKPSCYLKLQIGKKGVKAKTAAQSSTKNPTWKERIVLSPVESLELDLRVQVYDKHIFGQDDQLGETLKIPLSSLTIGVERQCWLPVPQTPEEETTEVNDDDSSSSQPAVHLALLLM